MKVVFVVPSSPDPEPFWQDVLRAAKVAAKHDASVLEETSSPDEAYARWGPEERTGYGGWLPS